MIREIIINELQNKGYSAKLNTIIKNGVKFNAIVISNNSNVAPVIYIDEILKKAEKKGTCLHEVVSEIIDIYERHYSISFNLENLYNRDFILDNVYIGLQKESTEDLVKRPCYLEGIESYLYIREQSHDVQYSIKLNKDLLDRAKITEYDAWRFAQNNTNAETTMQSMAVIIAEMCGVEYSEEMEEMTPLFVISNKNNVKGASAILNKELLLQFAEKYKTNKILVMPSSIHEMILAPYSEEMSIEEFSDMVSEINNSSVAPEERLTDRAYVIEI